MESHHDMLEPEESSPHPKHLYSRRQILKLGGISIVAAAASLPFWLEVHQRR